jgi:hypothetical protein
MNIFWIMKVIMDTNITGIDPKVWQILWDACNEGYDIRHFLDSMSPNQIQSKIWLTDTLEMILMDKNNIKVQLLGGWFGFPLCNLLMQKLNISLVENVDIDPRALRIFRKYHSDIEGVVFDSHERDACAVGNRDKDFHLIINTSSEHMVSLPEIIKNKKHNFECLFALQSNNMFHIDDHINCVNDENELVEKSGLSQIMYKGSLDMPNGYQRFMVIGYV